MGYKEEAPIITHEEQMKPIYIKLNNRIDEYKKMGKI